AYKMKSPTQELRFDILDKIMAAVPDFPLVLHGASSIPSQIVQIINENGGDIKNAHGIPTAQLQRATTTNICKINVDSDSRLAFTAAIRKNLRDAPDKFNPREYLGLAMQAVYDNTIDEITNIMGSANKLA
ncbi:MAG: class II fructose-bisphosphate aldolase, partial [Alphaproteobacteria bacterium]|nr:class II fructose-bisphosphate aldolase [Alphaproteobacteria bacterium]